MTGGCLGCGCVVGATSEMSPADGKISQTHMDDDWDVAHDAAAMMWSYDGAATVVIPVSTTVGWLWL